MYIDYKEHYAEEIRLLRKAMLNKKLIVFVGSGVSLDSGMPSWNEAIKQIAEKLNLPEDTKDNLDNIKIPQIYYNSRGKKEYVELMQEIFRYNEKLDITDTHRNIICLNAHTIITTNYDGLLEKAADENSEFVQVIGQDKDLPYKSVEKEILKIHGDFRRDNFVLKEDDYLHYSENFKLIEAYVKSLLATNVVLFIGYSFNDPDIKQIFSWVKDILADDFQRAYMLEVCKEYDELELEYYKNMGINVIYASNSDENFDKSFASNYTNEFLECLLEEDTDENKIDDLYNRCLSYSDLNYIGLQHINSIFGKYEIYVNSSNELIARDRKSEEANQLLLEIFDNTKNAHDGKISFIRNIVSKSIVQKFVTYQKEDDGSIIENCIPINNNISENLENLRTLIENFDFEGLKNLREQNEINLTDSNPELYLEQAYISYILFDFVKAYRYLRKCSKLFYMQKQFIWYFISEVNRKNIGRIISYGSVAECSGAERKKIEEEIKSLDIEVVYNKIPSTNPETKKFLQDLYTFKRYYYLFQDAYLISKKVDKEAMTNYTMFTSLPSYEKLQSQVQDCYYHDLYNYIMVDRYRENVEIYRLFASSILRSVCCTDIFDDIGTGNIHIDCLNKFDIYIILRYMSKDELRTIAKNNNNKFIKIDEDARKYLQNIVKNISKIKTFGCNYWNLYLVLSRYLELDYELTSETIVGMLNSLNDHTIRVYYIEIMNFLWWADRQDMFLSKECLDIFIDFIEKLINSFEYTKEKSQYIKVLEQALAVYKNAKGDFYYSETLLKLTDLLEIEFLSIIYPWCNNDIKGKIQSIAVEWEWKNDYLQVETYMQLVLHDIMEADEIIENNILGILKSMQKNDSGIRIAPDPCENIISTLSILYMNDKVCNKAKVAEVINRSDNDFYKWLIDYKNFDYGNFNINWINRCSDSLLEDIAAVPIAKQKIADKMIEACRYDNVDKRVMEKYLEFFVDKESK